MPNYGLGPRPGGNSSKLGVTAATVVKASPGTVYNVNVVVAGSAVGSVNDCTTTGAVAASNQIATIPEAVGNYAIGPFPAFAGIVIVPPTGATVSIAYS